MYFLGGQNHGSYRLLFLGVQLGGPKFPNRGSFCLIGQNNGSHHLNKPKTMGAVAQNKHVMGTGELEMALRMPLEAHFEHF